jgi:hypothetical protein
MNHTMLNGTINGLIAERPNGFICIGCRCTSTSTRTRTTHRSNGFNGFEVNGSRV